MPSTTGIARTAISQALQAIASAMRRTTTDHPARVMCCSMTKNRAPRVSARNSAKLTR